MLVKNLRAYCANENMTIKQFAEKIYYSPEYVHAAISGRLLPSKKFVAAVLNATGGVIKFVPKPDKRKKQKQEQEQPTSAGGLV